MTALFESIKWQVCKDRGLDLNDPEAHRISVAIYKEEMAEQDYRDWQNTRMDAYYGGCS